MGRKKARLWKAHAHRWKLSTKVKKQNRKNFLAGRTGLLRRWT